MRPRTKAEREAILKQKQRRRTLFGMILGGVVLLAIAGIIISLSKPQPKAEIEVVGSPSLKVDQEKIDMGNVRLGNTVNASFKLTNVGDQPLEITKAPYINILEGCWPPIPTIGSMVLKPGESTRLTMQFQMHGNMGGKHNFEVHIPTNDPTQADRTVNVLSNWVQ